MQAVSGRAQVHVFGDTALLVNRPAAPITLIIERGRLVDTENATPAFREVPNIITCNESEVWVREQGFGMNQAFTRVSWNDDIGTYECI